MQDKYKHDRPQTIQFNFGPTPDAFGCLTSAYRSGDRIGSLKLMPPGHLWDGEFWRDGEYPEPEHWVLYVDGCRFAELSADGDLFAKVAGVLERIAV